MLVATATITKATTQPGQTHHYLLVVVARGQVVAQYNITTAQAKRLGFKPLNAGGRGQVVQGTYYPGVGQFG